MLVKLGQQTHGFIQSNTPNYNASQIVKGLQFIGDRKTVYFWTDKQVEEVIAVVEGAGIARAVARLEPLAVIKG